MPPTPAAPVSAGQTVCPNCGAAVSPDAAQGLCPKCLFAGLATSTGADPQRSSTVVPELAAIAAAFPHLEILGLIGAGGMGAVFKARQPKLNRFVALKILPESLGNDPMFAERFAREGQLLARLSHPNIVTIHDFGHASGFYYLLMEYVDGVNLREAMRASRFTAAQALAIVPKICEALQFAHEEGVLHRDIKPENILLDAKGRLKLADFGIAKLVTEREAALTGAPAGESALTAAHGALGTPQYMAPEQRAAPSEVDHRADIYSLGVVFYELLTGELPAANFAPPSTRSDADERVDAIVRQALEKEPRRRQRNAGEVKTQIETIAARGDTTVPLVPNTGSAAPPSGTARLALAFLIAGILTPLLLLALYRLNGGGLALSGTCFLLALVFGSMSRKERVGKASAVAAVVIPLLAIATTAAVLLGDEWLTSSTGSQQATVRGEWVEVTRDFVEPSTASTEASWLIRTSAPGTLVFKFGQVRLETRSSQETASPAVHESRLRITLSSTPHPKRVHYLADLEGEAGEGFIEGELETITGDLRRATGKIGAGLTTELTIFRIGRQQAKIQVIPAAATAGGQGSSAARNFSSDAPPKAIEIAASRSSTAGDESPEEFTITILGSDRALFQKTACNLDRLERFLLSAGFDGAQRVVLVGGELARPADLIRGRRTIEALHEAVGAETELQGNWQVITQITSGRDTTASAAGARLSFRGQRQVRVMPDGSKRMTSIRVDRTQSPRQLDIVALEGAVERGSTGAAAQELAIYRFDGNKLIIALNRQAPTRRPRGFFSGTDNGIELMTLERTAPASKYTENLSTAPPPEVEASSRSEPNKPSRP